MSINVKTQQTVIDALSMDCRNHRKTVLCHTPSGVRTDAELFISSQDRLAELFTGEVGSTIAVFPNISFVRRLCKQSWYQKFSVELVFAVNSYCDPCMLALDIMNKFRMFQATEITEGRQRPAIMHAYGGAKAGMERSLASIAAEGWIPMAAAMLGTAGKPPMWASVGLRPVAGTTIDFRVLPPSLSEREKLLMLSCWQQWDAAGVPGSALSQWLVGIDVDSGPDGRNSPTYLKQNFDAQEAADLYQAVHLHTLEDLGENGPYPKVISQLALRIITYEYPLEAILAIYYLSATGHGDTKLAATIQNEAEWADAKIILSKLENVVVEAESQHGVVVWSSTQNCPSTIPADSYPLQLIVVPGGISCILSPGTFPSDLTKKDSRSTDLRWLPWKKLLMSRASLEARRQYRLLHWAGVRLHMNSWCSITLDWIAPSIGMHSCLTSCRRFSSRVPQPVGLLLWKCLEPRTLHRPTAECPTYCGPTQ